MYLTDNYLEIDIGYGAYTSAAAFRKNWKVLFDKSGTVDQAMRISWERIKDNPSDGQITECADAVWHNLIHAAVAIKRKQHWRAVAEIELARSWFIKLLGCRYGLDIERYREVDKLSVAELDILQKTLISSLTPDALWSTLITLVDAVYTELERYGERINISVNRQQVNEYINACRNLS